MFNKKSLLPHYKDPKWVVCLAFILCYVIFLTNFLGVTDFREKERAVIWFTNSYCQFRAMWIKDLLPPTPLNSHMNPACALLVWGMESRGMESMHSHYPQVAHKLWDQSLQDYPCGWSPENVAVMSWARPSCHKIYKESYKIKLYQV